MNLVSDNLQGYISGQKLRREIIKIGQIKSLQIKLLHLATLQDCIRAERKLHFTAIELERSSICNNGKLTLREVCLAYSQIKFISQIRSCLNFHA